MSGDEFLMLEFVKAEFVLSNYQSYLSLIYFNPTLFLAIFEIARRKHNSIAKRFLNPKNISKISKVKVASR